jgi:DNA-binding NarL/FixJ family response regulator
VEKIRVLLVDDHGVVRDGLCSLLSERQGIEIAGQAGDGLEAVRMVAELEPDVVVMDISMPRLDGIEATRRITRDYPDCFVLVLSQYDEDEQVLDAIEAGASGYLLKRAAGAQLTQAVLDIARGGAVLHPTAARVLIDAFLACGGRQCLDSYQRLTDREKEVLILVAEGYTNQRMADLLHVSPKTVDGHRTSLMAKLGLHDKTEVLKYALRKRLIEL